jgi:hypothetical protein
MSSKETLKEIIRMRTLIINLLATALLLFGASSASAFGLSMSLNPGSSPASTAVVAPSDFVIVDVYLDADPGLGFLIVAVLFDDDGILVYEPGNSGTPSYILYSPGAGTSSPTYVVPENSPPTYWGGDQQPGKLQINLAYLEASLGSATATGLGIWIGTIVFHVAQIGDGASTVSIALLPGGLTIVEAYGNDVQGLTSVSGSFTFHTVPEPTTALLIGFGLVGLTMAGRRKN